MMNSCNFIGNLGKDWDTRYTQDGKCIATNSIAEKNWKGDTVWIPITAFGKTAENLAKYTLKGTSIGLTCEYSTGKYEKDGRTVYTHTFIVSKFTFVGGSKPQGQQNQNIQGGYQQSHGNGNGYQNGPGPGGFHQPPGDQDIPF